MKGEVLLWKVSSYTRYPCKGEVLYVCTLKGYAPLIKEREVPFWEVVPCRGCPIMEGGFSLFKITLKERLIYMHYTLKGYVSLWKEKDHYETWPLK